MGYRYSQADARNLDWFPSDPSCQTLRKIAISQGNVRGLKNISISFDYPITAIAGRNGTGKTTILALAACAYHNDNQGFRLPDRKKSYYTFADFFIQTDEEKALDDVKIWYSIHHNAWATPQKEGIAWQSRYKRQGGRWNNYDARVDRTVVYLGINRIVPHSEKSVSKNYRGYFRRTKPEGWEEKVKSIAAEILSRSYGLFQFRKHNKYRLPLTTRDELVYSGFNMGAGEEAIFEMLSIIMECPRGALILIDEIELGLHEEAQAKLIQELKKLCVERHIQIICTTHSAQILNTLPPEGRMFLERYGDIINVTAGVSANFATGKMSGRPSDELDVLVEDETASAIISFCLSKDVRCRINIMPIGSAASVVRHLAARYKEAVILNGIGSRTRLSTNVCAILDGDKSRDKADHQKIFSDALEREFEGASEWASSHIDYLPGNTWPEKWLFQQISNELVPALREEFGVTSNDEMKDIAQRSLQAGKHNELYTCAQLLSCDIESVTRALIKLALNGNLEDKRRLSRFVFSFL